MARKKKSFLSEHAEGYLKNLHKIMADQDGERTNLTSEDVLEVVRTSAYIPIGKSTRGSLLWAFWDWHHGRLDILVVKLKKHGRKTVIESIWGKDFVLWETLKKRPEVVEKDAREKAIKAGLCTRRPCPPD